MSLRRSAPRVAIVLALLLTAAALASALALPTSGRSPATSPLATATNPVTGSVGGTHLIGVGGHAGYFFNATGGPAYAANGSRVGNLTYYASVSGTNTTGVTLNPDQEAIFNGSSSVSTLTVNSVPQTLTINVMFSSVYRGTNESVNLTYTVNIVAPYVLSATIVDVSSSDVISFPVDIYLDGNFVGNVTVSTLSPSTPYHFSFDYLTLGLSPGWHTFSISLASEHGLVVFAGGATSFSQSFYVPGPAPNYTLWYIVGIVAFVGTIFILLTRVAARRRGAARK